MHSMDHQCEIHLFPTLSPILFGLAADEGRLNCSAFPSVHLHRKKCLKLCILAELCLASRTPAAEVFLLWSPSLLLAHVLIAGLFTSLPFTLGYSELLVNLDCSCWTMGSYVHVYEMESLASFSRAQASPPEDWKAEKPWGCLCYFLPAFLFLSLWHSLFAD